MKDPQAMLQKLARRPGNSRPSPWPGRFVLSTGAILALAGANRLLDGLASGQLLDLQDPVSGLPFRYLLLLAGVAELGLAWLCLFTNKRTLSLWLVLWLMFNFAVYRVGLWTMGWQHPRVFVGGLADLLRVSPLLADSLLCETTLYLMAGSLTVLLLPRKKLAVLQEPVEYFKVRCSGCDGKTAFSGQWAGRTIPCPHCGAPMTLQSAPAGMEVKDA